MEVGNGDWKWEMKVCMDFLTVMENKLDEGRMITFEEAVELAKGKIEDEKLFYWQISFAKEYGPKSGPLLDN